MMMRTPEEVELLSPKSDHAFSDRSKPDIPDGGIRAWSTVAGSWFMMFATFGYLNSFGVYQDFYTREFLSHNQPSKIALVDYYVECPFFRRLPIRWIGSLQLAMPFALGLVSGKLFDIGCFRVLVITGSVIFGFSHLMPKLGFAQAVRATAYIVVGCLIAANGLMRNNPAAYNLRAKAPPLDIISFLRDVPYMMGVFG
ncbi:hypothetical protein C0992_005094 [Termitomyces sp. T32_za158]|nr:hypothetical protein C0992_005094 [Termitomyces sp. T32_za158]